MNEQWRITSASEAVWALRRLAGLHALMEEKRTLAGDEIARLTHWLKSALAEIQRDVDFFEGHLKVWALAERERTGDATIKLPTGMIKTVRQPARINIEDEDVLLKWIRESNLTDDFTKTSVTVDKARIKANMIVDVTTHEPVVLFEGEIVPGLTVVPESVSVNVIPTSTDTFTMEGAPDE